ncbi:MAG: FliM/FliN family flagellar motor switch protein [Planctomycetales bacterium]|nr:FliM/FliN family flagellar motor switch protein [Planctomycetales bacterium]
MADDEVREDENDAATAAEVEASADTESDAGTDAGTAADASEATATATAAAPEIDPESVKVPEFTTMKEGLGKGSAGGLDRFYDVHVPIWAELGRVELPLGELVRLSEGAVVRLERPISEPVDVVSQGVKLARGEVIVIDDCFAIRIKEIVASK